MMRFYIHPTYRISAICSWSLFIFWSNAALVLGRVAFEKLTDLDYRGTTYYTVKNITLNECQAWCREELECQAAVFSFVLNPLTPIQDTSCELQNETTANNPAAIPQRSVNLYYMVKLQIRSDNVCMRPWAFERVPNKMIRGLDNALIYTSTKEACLAACLNEHRFTCRSVEYNYVTLQCHLSDSDRRTTGQYVQFADTQGVDYFENLCLKGNQACKGNRVFQVPRIGVAEDKVAHYASIHYYVDKELQVTSEAACRLACEIENEFLCRSFLYKGPPSGNQYNCQLFHLDHKTLPDGTNTYLNGERPLIDDGQLIGTYYENHCEKSSGSLTHENVPVVFESITEDPNINNLTRNDINCDKTGTCYDVTVHCKDTRIAVQVRTNKPFNGRIYALGRSETCNIDVLNSDLFRLDLTMSGQDCNTQSVTGVFSNTVVIQHHSVVMTKADKIYKVKCTYDMSSKNITFGMMPIRDPEMISITSAPEAPAPRIRILDTRSREVETVRIGDKLTFRIEIPEESKKPPYGIFARSCVAMAKDSKSTFQIIDDEGCPVDPGIFPSFTPDGNALQSIYEAFRFTESYGVIFQCNVKYCLGPCEPAVCDWGRESVESWGRRKRDVSSSNNNSNSEGDDMTQISQEILVLDFGDEKQSQYLKNNNEAYFTHYDKDKTITVMEPCPTKTSVLALGITCILLILIYVTTLFFYYLRKWMSPRKFMT